MKDIGERSVLRNQILYFILIYQIRNATDGFLVPLRATRSGSVFSKILLNFHIPHNINREFCNYPIQ